MNKNFFSIQQGPWTLTASGDHALTLTHEGKISPRTNARIRHLTDLLGTWKEILSVIPAFTSLTILYDPCRISARKLSSRVLSLAGSEVKEDASSSRLFVIPVLYGGDYGPDLASLAALKNMSEEELIRRHTAPAYLIHMMGFLPGFAYLGGLPEELTAPRLKTPREKIPAGSVGIGGSQTGIYPLDSPGGWQLIGRTPLRPYEKGREPQFLYQAGDHLKFRPITEEEYHRIEDEISEGIYQVEVIDHE